MSHQVDPDFLALPLAAVSDAAISTGTSLGASHVDIRVQRVRTGILQLRDTNPETQSDESVSGIGVRVIVNGAWGFASSPEISVDKAKELAHIAVAMAKTSGPLSTEEIALAPEPVYANRTWVSDYEIDPFEVSGAEKIARLADLNARLLKSDAVNFASAFSMFVKEQKHYADSYGTSTTQQRVRVQTQIEAFNVGANGFESIRTLAQPAGYGWEWMGNSVWNWDQEIDELPELLSEKVSAPSIEPGRYDLLIHPSNLWLTIHESIGHATELDRDDLFHAFGRTAHLPVEDDVSAGPVAYPQVAGLCFLVAGDEVFDGRFVHLDVAAPDDACIDFAVDQAQRVGAQIRPAPQGLPGQDDSVAGRVNLLLAIEGQVVAVAGHNHLRQETGCRDAALLQYRR